MQSKQDIHKIHLHTGNLMTNPGRKLYSSISWYQEKICFLCVTILNHLTS